MRFVPVNQLTVILLTAGIFFGCKADVVEPPPVVVGPPWIVFTTSNSPLPNSVINAIHVDIHNKVWIATGNGAASYSSRSWAIFRDSLKYLVYDSYNNSYVVCNVNSIALSKDQSVWFGLRGGGLVRYDKNSQTGHIWTRYKIPTIQTNLVNSIACDLSEATTYGEVWITSSLGVDRFIQTSDDRGDWHYLGGLPNRSSQNTVAVRNSFDNSLWIGSDGDGIAVVSFFPILTFSRVDFPPGANFRVTGIAFESQKSVWISTENGILNVDLQSGNWIEHNHLSEPANIPLGEMHSVETNEGTDRWFGTDSGLVHLSDTTWTRFRPSNSPLPNDIVTAIKYDFYGNLWIGTRNGLAVYNPTGVRM